MPPWFVRRCLIPLHERLIGRDTIPRLAELEQSQWWPLDRLRDLQQQKLRTLLTRARQWSPYYRRHLDDAGLDPSRIRLFDLPRIPTIDKHHITAWRDDLIDPSAKKNLHPACTGGSTGNPLHFFMDRSRQAADQAARARSRLWFGINLGERELYLWGSPIENSTAHRVKTLRDRMTNQRLINAFRMTTDRMTRYLDEVHRFDPVHFFGYPSSLAALARFAKDSGRSPRNKSLRAVFVTGESLHFDDRTILESAFDVPVADGYGSREAGFIAHQCPHHSYHVAMESLIVELLLPDGRPADPGESAEVVVTHLDAHGMPFIRYRTGDLARRASKSCPCGRELEVLAGIDGRRTDMLRRSDGGLAHGLSVIYVLREEPAVARFKVHQDMKRDLDVTIVPREMLDDRCRRRIESRLRGQLGHVAVRLNLTDEIPPDPSGKHRHVTSEAV